MCGLQGSGLHLLLSRVSGALCLMDEISLICLSLLSIN